MSKIYQTLIIGGGPAGVSAALYLKRAGIEPVIIENGPNALAKAHLIENYYGVTLEGKALYEQGLNQAKALDITIIHDEVIAVDYLEGYQVITSGGLTLEAPSMLLATGTKNITLKLPKLEELTGRGISYCAVCDGFFFRGKRVAVLGNGAYALHEAEYLSQLAASVVVLTNGLDASLAEEAGFVVDKRNLSALEGDSRLEKILFKEGEPLEVDGLFIALGTADSTDLAVKLGAEVNGRFIKIDEMGRTLLPGLYGAGDCTGGLLQVAKAVQQGAAAALDIIKYVRASKN